MIKIYISWNIRHFIVILASVPKVDITSEHDIILAKLLIYYQKVLPG